MHMHDGRIPQVTVIGNARTSGVGDDGQVSPALCVRQLVLLSMSVDRQAARPKS